MRKDESRGVVGSVRKQAMPEETRTHAAAEGMVTSRRELLTNVGKGMVAGVFSGTIGMAFADELQVGQQQANPRMAPRAQSKSGKTPITLIIDDGSPVDPMFYLSPGYQTPLLVPTEFTQRLAETFERFDMRGKLTMLPMPSCLGRIDQSLKLVPPDHLAEFLKLVRERIAPRFDITPEFLTHLRAYDIKQGEYRHIFEDVWISRAPVEEIVEYFVLAFTILKNVGLNATGITSPWDAGIGVEGTYARALAEAHWRVFGQKMTWYFLHGTYWREPRQCSVEYEDRGRGQVVVSVPANFADLFWSMDLPTRDERQQFIRSNIDRVLSADGRTGRIRQLIDSGHPLTLLTHWQSLYTQGTGLGLEGLNALMERIQKVFGSSLEWVTCSEIAARYVASTHMHTSP